MAPIATSLAKIGGSTLVSRILGFVRDLIVARVFGADGATDAFFVAFRVPNAVRRLFGEGTLAMALVPVLADYRHRRGAAALKGLVDGLAGTLGAGLMLATAAGLLAAPVLVLVFAPGFAATPERWDLASEMLRLTLPYVLFVTLAALAGAVLNVHERFGVPAFTPVLLNLSLIGCALLLAPLLERPILALAWGVLVGGLAQLAFQLPFLARLKLLPRPRWRPRDPGVKRSLGHLVPAMLGASVGQINMLVGTVLASFLAGGSLSWLYYADRLMELPVGLLGAALGTVILPRLARLHGAGEGAAFSETLDWALRWALVAGVPAAVGLATLAGPIAATLFYGGAGSAADADGGGFSGRDVAMTAGALACYAAGLVGLLGIKVLAPGYFARERMRAPVRMGLAAVTVNAVLGLALMGPLGHLGIALATAVSALANAGLLLWGLRRDGTYRPAPGWGALCARVLAANAAMGAVLLSGSGGLEPWLALGGGERAVRLALWIGGGAAVYVLVLLAGGLRLRHLLGRRSGVGEGAPGGPVGA